MIIELLLAAHCRDCTTCVKSGDCNLQTLAHRFGVTKVRFQNYREVVADWISSSPSIVRDPNKCILCGNCVRVCDELQGVGALDFAYRGSDAMVMPAFDQEIASNGLCKLWSVSDLLSDRRDQHQVSDRGCGMGGTWMIRMCVSMAQVAPAVRVAVGDAPLGFRRAESVMGKIVNVLHRMGFDEVYDTDIQCGSYDYGGVCRVPGSGSEKWRKASASDVLLSGMGKICRRSVPGLYRRMYPPAVPHRV